MISFIHYYFFVSDEIPASYWRDLAEERRLSLAEALSENETVSKTVYLIDSKMVKLVNFSQIIPELGLYK